MASYTEEMLLKQKNGENLLLHEVRTAQLESLRTELAGPHPSPIERLLVERVVACWLQVCVADYGAAQRGSHTFVQGDYDQRRQDRAHKRFLSAVRTLATVRRLALPIRVDVSVAGTFETTITASAMAPDRFRLPVSVSN